MEFGRLLRRNGPRGEKSIYTQILPHADDWARHRCAYVHETWSTPIHIHRLTHTHTHFREIITPFSINLRRAREIHPHLFPEFSFGLARISRRQFAREIKLAGRVYVCATAMQRPGPAATNNPSEIRPLAQRMRNPLPRICSGSLTYIYIYTNFSRLSSRPSAYTFYFQEIYTHVYNTYWKAADRRFVLIAEGCSYTRVAARGGETASHTIRLCTAMWTSAPSWRMAFCKSASSLRDEGGRACANRVYTRGV